MTLCSEVEEEMDEKDNSQENYLGEIDTMLAIVEILPICLN